MKQNMDDLKELEELKTAYDLLDQRLDGQEIVSDEQLRAVMERRLTGVRRYTKTFLLTLNIAAIPLMAVLMYLDDRLDKEKIIGLVIMWVASLLFGILFLRKTGRENYAYSDLTTVCKRDAKYQKLLKIYNYTVCLYWIGFSFVGALFSLHSTEEIIVWVVLALLASGAVVLGTIGGKAIAEDISTVDPKTGMRTTPKWLSVLIIIIFLAVIIFRIIIKNL